MIQPSWDNHLDISACNVSAKDFQNPCPSNLSQALDQNNKDKNTWKLSYSEEYNDLKRMNVYGEITLEEYSKIKYKCGGVIHMMCLLTIKYKNGYPDRAKCRIVVLGNQQQQNYTKGEKYVPVIMQNQFRSLLSIAMQHQ